MNSWLSMWSWRIQENAAPRRPAWLHLIVCPFCRGMARYCRQQARQRQAAS